MGNEKQLTIYDYLNDNFKIDKPIRLIELFSGYGSQALALKYLGVNFEHWKTCEWATKSIQAYKDIHFTNDINDYSDGLDRKQLVEYLYKKGISSNYNEPMSYNQINRLGITKLKEIYNNIISTHNLVNIQQVKGCDFDIVDKDKYIYICTYSFPCQDLSLAGKGKGMSDTSTRSGMLWEVERILKELQPKNQLPQVLIMENVQQVHSSKNVDDFIKWKNSLEQMGYNNFYKDLIATDYGIPQTRKRCFMISILGDYKYSFPKPIPLELKLKDLLEDNVDKKYYLSDKLLKCFLQPSESSKIYGRDKQFLRGINRKYAATITTRAGNMATDNFVLTKDTENYIEWEDGKNIQMNCRAWKEDKVVATLNTSGETKILKNNLRIRKLTPKECFRLMGVKDEDYEKCAKNQSNASLYHLAGDSIVVNVLMAIFKEII